MNSKTPLTIAIVEAGLELVPKELWREPGVISTARRRKKKPGEILLDMSLHYHAMKKYLRDWFKRGRPDIVHVMLLNALSSPLNIEGLLRIYIHTIQGLLIWVNPSTRIPRNYNRFVGLMEQLLIEGQVPTKTDKPLMKVLELDLKKFINEENFSEVILMDERGEHMKLDEFSRLVTSNKSLVMIGGFQRGTFSQYIESLATRKISIYPKSLDAWVVISRVIESVERAYGIF